MPIPLDTLSCTIDENGISAPSYADILATIQYRYRGIYGQDVNLDDNTQDGQWLAILATQQNDSNAATIAAFNAQSPSSAQGNGLSSIVKLNGLQRQAFSNSTAVVNIVGRTGTTITNGVIGDNVGLNTKWNLPPLFMIPDSGIAVVTATCQSSGAITAAENTLTEILTPTRNWQTATNPSSAFPGNPVENDATLRQRQSLSQSLPSQSPVGATLAAILELSGVERGTYDENATGAPDGNGVPAHAVAFIIGGGDVVEIAQTIQRKKTPGTPTYGTTTETVNDPAGVSIAISFFVLELETVTVEISLNALTGYADTTGVLIQQAVSNYISSLAIGSIVYLNKVAAVAALMTNPLNTTFEITALTLNMASADVTIPFNKAPVTLTSDVSLSVGP